MQAIILTVIAFILIGMASLCLRSRPSKSAPDYRLTAEDNDDSADLAGVATGAPGRGDKATSLGIRD